LTSAWRAGWKGIEESRIVGSGILGMCGLCRESMFQSSQVRMSLDRSVMISAMGHQRKGQGEPPKVSRREIRPMSSITVELAAAECPHMVSLL